MKARRVVPLALAAASIAVIAVIGLAAIGRARWKTSTRTLLDALEAARQPAPTTHYDARELEGLPAPVQRYFRAALTDGQRLVTAATIELAGSFNLDPKGERWKAFTSTQRAVMHRPGFVWNGHVALAPGIAVHVHDAYIAGTGILQPSVLGLYALGGVRGEGEIARDELMRYFAEAAWYPTALLPSQGVRWEAVDAHSADATLSDGPLSVTMQATFDDAGLIESCHFDARGATVDGVTVLTPWEGRWSGHALRDGMRVPLIGEASWLPETGRRTYFRGSVTALAYEFSPTAPASIPLA